MRIITLLFFLTILNIHSFGQKISYKIPEGYEHDINKEDYKKIVDLAVPIVNKSKWDKIVQEHFENIFASIVRAKSIVIC